MRIPIGTEVIIDRFVNNPRRDAENYGWIVDGWITPESLNDALQYHLRHPYGGSTIARHEQLTISLQTQ